MQTEQSIAILKALADPSRLAIVNSLLEQPHYVEELAKRHALAPSTISFHLRKLERAGLVSSRKEQYYVVITVNEALFNTTLRQIVGAAPGSKGQQQQRLAEYRHKVLESFFRHGRLEKLPAQHKKRLIVLEEFAARFEPGRRYREAEVSDLILPLFADYCTIRRLLVDEGLIRRQGTDYWREPVATDRPEPQTKENEAMKPAEQRRQIKRTLKQQQPPMGIFQLRCTANGRIYVAASRNLDGERNSRLFQLKMGKMVFSRDLQQDLDAFGAKAFEFSVLEVMEPPAPGQDPELVLSALECAWQEKLQPFGPRGYNSERAFRRNRERLQASLPEWG